MLRIPAEVGSAADEGTHRVRRGGGGRWASSNLVVTHAAHHAVPCHEAAPKHARARGAYDVAELLHKSELIKVGQPANSGCSAATERHANPIKFRSTASVTERTSRRCERVIDRGNGSSVGPACRHGPGKRAGAHLNGLLIHGGIIDGWALLARQHLLQLLLHRRTTSDREAKSCRKQPRAAREQLRARAMGTTGLLISGNDIVSIKFTAVKVQQDRLSGEYAAARGQLVQAGCAAVR